MLHRFQKQSRCFVFFHVLLSISLGISNEVRDGLVHLLIPESKRIAFQALHLAIAAKLKSFTGYKF